MTSIRIVQHERDDARTVHLILADEHLVGTAVELAGDRIAPWRLTIRDCCANLRYSSRLVVEQAVARFLREFPEAFVVPTGPVQERPARTRSVEPITPPPTTQETST